LVNRQRTDAWTEIVRTATAVRAVSPGAAEPEPASRWRDWLRPLLITAVATAAGAVCAVALAHSVVPVAADTGADSTLFSLTNQDRSSNGVHSLNFNGTLENIGEGAPYHCGGITVDGRSVDMVRRGYFSHVIQGCGQYVFSMMQAYGVRYQSAGENIGWVDNESNGSSAASYINGQFMNSPEHRANILNGNYTAMGAGSAFSSSWTCSDCGSAGPYPSLWMFSEEFAQLASSAPPPTPRPAPRPTPAPVFSNPPRNSPAPAPPAQAPATTAPSATPAPTATPTPTPTPIPAALLPGAVPAPPTYQYPGLLTSSVESVLEAFLLI
jgi:uncharacterized protein YkwD